MIIAKRYKAIFQKPQRGDILHYDTSAKKKTTNKHHNAMSTFQGLSYSRDYGGGYKHFTLIGFYWVLFIHQ